jgi:hypothetical protein
MEKNPFIAEGTEIARNGAANDKCERGGAIEEWISQEARPRGVRHERF